MNATRSRQLLVSTGFAVLLISLVWLGLRLSGASVPIIHLSWSTDGQSAYSDPGKATAFEPTHADNLPLTKALKVQDAIKRGDYGEAEAVSYEMLSSKHHPEVWNAYPSTSFAFAISDLTDPDFESRLTAWVERDPSKPLPNLLRAQFFYDRAWFRRGQAYSSKVGPDAMRDFGADLGRAYDDIGRVLSVDHTNAYALYLRLIILHGYGMTPAMEDALQEAIEAYPDFVQPAHVVLDVLQPKWGGSIEAMYAFVSAMTKGVPADSPMKLLDLDLYRYIIQIAYDECVEDKPTNDVLSACIQKNVKLTMTSDLEGRAVRALALFGRKNEYQTNLAIESILSDLLNIQGAEIYTAPILLATANGYGADTRLHQAQGAAFNFIIDKLVALSWFNKGYYENAMAKYQEALTHLDSASFPSDEQKLEAIASIQASLVRIYDKQGQFPQAIAAAKAALDASGNVWNRIELCYAHYELKQYDQAVAECSRAVSDPANSMTAYYWRARAYLELHDGDDALKDYAVVAASQHAWRATSVIDMSMIYFNRNDNKGALELLNRYPYLYDANITDKSDVAVAYNNRCYAYMELGELKKALDDCNASLTYGTIPDAYKKQQELMKQLSASK